MLSTTYWTKYAEICKQLDDCDENVFRLVALLKADEAEDMYRTLDEIQHWRTRRAWLVDEMGELMQEHHGGR